jgi:D-sedoheptulose 7-phosphate isomerase
MADRARPFVLEEIGKTVALLTALAADDGLIDAVARAASLCAEAIRGGHKVLLAGNGGSAADAQHLAAELVGRLNYDRPGVAAIALTTDSSILTAIGNDYGYGEVFRRQVDAIGAAGDVLIALSTSGRSKSVLNALDAARAKGMVTIGLSGASGGDMPGRCDLCLLAPSRETQKIQEAHIVLGHIVCGLVEQALFPRAPG